VLDKPGAYFLLEGILKIKPRRKRLSCITKVLWWIDRQNVAPVLLRNMKVGHRNVVFG